ncbi:MAG: hypothetical protein WAX44_00495 [Minisyncoccia bacterium]
MSEKKLWIAVSFLIVLVSFGVVSTLNYWNVNNSSVPNSPGEVFCTMEAKLCPDGVTYVGRSGDKCEFSECPKIDLLQNRVTVGQEIVLNKVKITPLKVLSDSRCPKDVECIWAGTVRVLVRLEREGGIQETELELNNPITFVGGRVSLDSVYPEKTQSEISQKEYQFVFGVLPGDGE